MSYPWTKDPNSERGGGWDTETSGPVGGNVPRKEGSVKEGRNHYHYPIESSVITTSVRRKGLRWELTSSPELGVLGGVSETKFLREITSPRPRDLPHPDPSGV